MNSGKHGPQTDFLKSENPFSLTFNPPGWTPRRVFFLKICENTKVFKGLQKQRRIIYLMYITLNVPYSLVFCLFPVGKPGYNHGMNTKTCEHCKREFLYQRKTARFCCDTCRTLAHLATKREEERAENPDKPRRKRKEAIQETEAERLARLKAAVNRLPR